MNDYFVYLYIFPNGKVYVGQSKHSSKRYNYKFSYRKQVVYNAMKKYPHFKCEILIDNLSVEEADRWERYYISFYKSNIRNFGYNIENGGRLNHKDLSKYTRIKISKSNKGRKHTEEWKKQHSEYMKNNPNSGQFKKGGPNYWKGKHRSEEQKIKQHYAMKGKHSSPKTEFKPMSIKEINLENGMVRIYKSIQHIPYSYVRRYIHRFIDDGKIYKEKYKYVKYAK